MNSITQNHQDEELLSKKMQVFFRRYQVSRILRAANAYKLRGVPVLSIFLLVFRMVFQQRSVYTQMHLQRTAMPFGKDTFYRFMNSCRIPLAQVHDRACRRHHSCHARSPDSCGSHQRAHPRRFHLPSPPFQEGGASRPSLRPRQEGVLLWLPLTPPQLLYF